MGIDLFSSAQCCVHFYGKNYCILHSVPLYLELRNQRIFLPNLPMIPLQLTKASPLVY